MHTYPVPIANNACYITYQVLLLITTIETLGRLTAGVSTIPRQTLARIEFVFAHLVDAPRIEALPLRITGLAKPDSFRGVEAAPSVL